MSLNLELSGNYALISAPSQAEPGRAHRLGVTVKQRGNDGGQTPVDHGSFYTMLNASFFFFSFFYSTVCNSVFLKLHNWLHLCLEGKVKRKKKTCLGFVSAVCKSKSVV